MNIEEEIFQVYNEIRNVQAKIGNKESTEALEYYSRQIFNLKIKLQKLEKDLYLHRNPDLESNEIDLYLINFHDKFDEKPDKFNYIITLHNTKTKIGKMEIRFNLLENEKYLGNIGANITEKYRGKRYFKKAFILLKDIMLEHNLRKPIFTVRENNLSSIKSLDTIGAKRVNYIDDSEPYYVYEYDFEQDENLKK